MTSSKLNDNIESIINENDDDDDLDVDIKNLNIDDILAETEDDNNDNEEVIKEKELKIDDIDHVKDIVISNEPMKIDIQITNNSNMMMMMNDDSDNEDLNENNVKTPEEVIMNPLELIDKQERQFSLNIEEQRELESKFPLRNMKEIHSHYNNINYFKHDKINSMVYSSNQDTFNHLGNPRCITAIPGRYIAIGTSRSDVLVFEFIKHVISPMKKLTIVKEMEYGPVTSMDICSKDECLICGYEGGQIILWDLKTGTSIKTIQGFHTTSILAIKFWKESKSNIISSDMAGNVYLFAINKVLLSFTIDKQVLLERASSPIFSIAPFSKDFIKNSTTTFVALACMEIILVVSLEPIIGIVYKFERPVHIREGFIPSVSWGTGSIPEKEENQDPLLLISWGSAIYLIQVKASENDHIKGFINVGFYHSDIELMHASWIAEGLIFAIDTRREFKILNSNEFEVRFDNKEDDINNILMPTHRAILNDQQIDTEISYQTYLRDSLGKVRALLSNTICSSSIAHKVFILGYKSIYEGELVTYDKCIKNMMREGRWLDAFILCLDIYKGNSRMFYNLSLNKQERKSQLKPLCYEAIRRYILQIGNIKYSNIEEEKQIWESAILITIDFLVTSDSFDYLFNQMIKIMNHFHQKDKFIANLEPFILCNRIKYIPNDTLREVIYYFKDCCNKPEVLQYLIINIDLEKIDIGYLITLCIENQLYTPLIYICTRNDPPDFMTPLVKIFSEYKYRLENQIPNAKDMGLKCLWFIKMTLDGKMFPDEALCYDLWCAKVIEIIIWVFDQNVMPLLVKLEPYLVFEIFRMIFDQKILNAIEDDQSSIIIYEDQSTQAVHRKLLFDIEQIEGKYAVLCDMVTLIYEIIIEIEEARIELYYFLGILSTSYGFRFKEKILKEIVLFLIKNPRNLPKWVIEKPLSFTNRNDSMEFLGDDDDNDNDNDNVGNKTIDIDEKIDIRVEILLRILRRLRNVISKKEIDELKGYVNDDNDLIEVKCVLTELEEDYRLCFDLFLDEEKSINQRKKVFKWLEYILKYLAKTNNTKQIKMLKEAILQHINQLIELNTIKVRKIVNSQDKEFEIEAIKRLNTYPKQQLEYLSEVMLQRKTKPVNDNLLRLYITLLCKLEPKKVLNELKTFDHDLDFCISICKEYNNQEGLAFVLEKAGLISESLNLHMIIFARLIAEKIKKMEKNGKYNGKKLIYRMNETKELCKKYNKIGDHDSEKLWFTVLDKSLEVHKTYIAPKKDLKPFRDLIYTYSEIISCLFDDIMNYVALESLANKLKRGFIAGSIHLGDLRPSLLNLLSNYYYESNILEDARSLMVNDNVDEMIRYHTELNKGRKGEKLEVDHNTIDKIIVFNCNHTIPRAYMMGTNTCNLCNKNDTAKLYNLTWSLFKGSGLSEKIAKLKSPGLTKTENKEDTDKKDSNRTTEDDMTESNNESSDILFQTRLLQREKSLRQLLIFDRKITQEIDMIEEWRYAYDNDL